MLEKEPGDHNIEHEVEQIINNAFKAPRIDRSKPIKIPKAPVQRSASQPSRFRITLPTPLSSATNPRILGIIMVLAGTFGVSTNVADYRSIHAEIDHQIRLSHPELTQKSIEQRRVLAYSPRANATAIPISSELAAIKEMQNNRDQLYQIGLDQNSDRQTKDVLFAVVSLGLGLVGTKLALIRSR